MNERIEKISEQARLYADNMYPSGLDIAKWGPAYQEKFADLIVQDLIDSMIKRYGDDDELPIQEIKLFVKEHFGVGE